MNIESQLWFCRVRRATVTALLALVGACSGDDVVAPPPPDTTLPLSVQVVGTGIVLSQPDGINCTSSTCNAVFVANTAVTLTANPGAGQSFTGWFGACTGTATTCIVNMDPARIAATPDVTARFAPLSSQSTFTFDITISGLGSVASNPAGINCSATCSASFPASTLVTLTAEPAANQSFAGWTGVCSGSANSCTVTLDQARSVGANFQTITASNFSLAMTTSGSGSVISSPVGINCGSTCSASFVAGTVVTLTAIPAAGQRFSSWSGACAGAQATCTLQLTQARDAQAVFVAAPAGSEFQAGQLLETNNDFNVTNNRQLLAVNSSGDSIVLWEQSDGLPDGSTYKVFSRRYQIATGWQPALAIAGLTRREGNPSVITGKLLLDNAGIATWINESLQTRRNSPATGWGNVFNAPTGASGNDLSSAVIDSSGGIDVLSSGSNVYHNTLAAGASTWGTWQRIDTSGSLVAYKAQLALSKNGTALAVWHERNPGDSNYSIKSARLVRGTGWSAPQSIEAQFTNLADESPKVAIDDQGNGIVMWLQNLGGVAIFYNVYRADTGWQGEVQVANPPDLLPTNSGIQLSMAADGRAVATWATGGGQRSVFGMQYTPATGWTAPIGIVTNLAERAFNLQTVISNTGQAVMTYMVLNTATAGTDLFSRSLNFGGQWSAATPLEAGVGGIGDSSFVMNQNGQGIVVWVQADQAVRDSRVSLWAAVLR